MNPRIPGVLAVLSVLAGCGAADAEPVPPRTGTTPIVVIRQYPGLAPAASRLALPSFSLQADGTAILAAKDRGIVVSGTRRTLSAAQVTDLFQRAADADLFRSHEYRRDVLDGSALVVQITSATGRHETSVVAPSSDEGGDRGRVVKFAAAATKAGDAAGDFRPERVAVVIVADSDESADVRPWPLDTPATGMPGYPNRPCLIVDGTGVAPLLTAVRTATPATRWTTDDRHRVALRVRPLLPYEHTCADIGQG
jgi:hypothetical protein